MNTSPLSNPAELVAETLGQERERCLVDIIRAIMLERIRTPGKQIDVEKPLHPSPIKDRRIATPRLQAENLNDEGKGPTQRGEKILNRPHAEPVSLRAITAFFFNSCRRIQPSLSLGLPTFIRSLAGGPLLFLALAPAFPLQLGGQTLLNAELTGTQNRIATGAELTVQSGATLTASAGSIVDLFHATVALPDSLTLKNIKVQGTANEVTDGATLTLLSGATFTAAAGSTVNLSAATIAFPTSVVLTTGNQTLTGKTLASPTLSGSVSLANGASIDLGTGEMSDPIADTIQPLKWGSGGRYMLNAGYTWFKSPAYPGGIIDHLGGLGYNLGTPPVPGDVQFGTIFESRFQNDPHGVDTEYYFAWNGPVGVPVESGGRNGRRIFQSNVSWGISNYSGTRLMGSAEWSFDLNRYSLRNGANADDTLAIELGANNSHRSTHTWSWYGGAAKFEGALTIGSNITQQNVSTNSFNGPTTFNNANLNVNSATNPLITLSQTASGDTGIRFNRLPNGLEYLQMGAAGNGTISGGLANSYFWDIVGPSVGAVRPLFLRSSSDSGANFSNLVRFAPLGNNGVAIRSYSTTEASDATTASVVLDGGLSVAKSLRIASTSASTSPTTGALVVAGGVGISGNLYSANYATTGIVSSKGSGNSAISMDSSNNSANLNLISNTIGNFRTVNFGYGGSPIVNWRLGYNGYFPNTWIGLYNNVSGGAMMLDGNNNLYLGNNNAAMAGSYNLALEGGVIDTRTTAPIVLRQNGATALTIANSTLSATFASTAQSTSITSGAVVVAGGVGIAGNQFLGGSLNLSGGGVLTGASGSLALTAGGTNQNISLTPSGSGVVVFAGPVRIASPTASTSTTTGALVVEGGVGISGSLYSANYATTGTVSSKGSGNSSASMNSSSNSATLNLISDSIGNYRTINFGYGGSPIVNWRLGYNGYFPNTWIGLYNNVSGGAMMLDGNNNLYLGNKNTAMAGSYNLALEGGVIDTRTPAPIVLRQNGATALTIANSTLSATFTSTAQSTSTTNGALVIAGGVGIAGNQFLGGSLNLSGGGVLTGASGSLALTAGGTNQNISLTPSGSGVVVFAGPVSTSGPLTVGATTNSTSTSTGALVVGGGVAVQKRTSLGDDLVLTPTSSTAATVRLSGTAVADVPGIWFRDGGAPTAANAALSGSSTATILNGPSGGTVNLRIANTNFLTLGTNAATLQGVPLNVTATTASISQTTGSATFGGGIGVNGRTSTKTLSVGNGAALDLILTVISVLDFPSVGANGGIQDLAVTLTGADLGDSVNIVEASGSFIPAGIALRAIVTAPNTVTVRASNVTTAAIDPASAAYRITLMSF